MKNILYSLPLFASASLFAAIDAGTYTGEIFDKLELNLTEQNSTWIFDNVTFTNSATFQQNTTADVDYKVQLKETSATLSSFQFNKNIATATDMTFELLGSEAKRSSLSGMTGWSVYLDTSTSDTLSASNILKLGGYSDFTTQNLCIASDYGILGTAGVDISGADNNFNVTGQFYMNRAKATDSNNHLYFNIKGEDGKKSTAVFTNNFTVEAAGSGLAEVNMNGNATMNVGTKFEIGVTASSGTVNFTMSGENNTLNSTATTNNWGHNFFVGSGATSGEISFTIGGKNNTLSVASNNCWIGTEKTDGDAKIYFNVIGSGHKIDFAGSVNFRQQGLDTTTLLFKSDDAGISTINVGSIGLFTGALEIDFSDFVGDGSGVYEMVLISASSDWASKANRFIGSGTSEIGSGTGDASVQMGDSGLSWEIKYLDNDLVFSYTYAVPEPSAYAMIFGALAFAFAAYRRRK